MKNPKSSNGNPYSFTRYYKLHTILESWTNRQHIKAVRMLDNCTLPKKKKKKLILDNCKHTMVKAN